MGGQHRNHWIASESLKEIKLRTGRRRGGEKRRRIRESKKKRRKREGAGKGKKGRWGEEKEGTLKKRQRSLHQKAKRQSLRYKEHLQA